MREISYRVEARGAVRTEHVLHILPLARVFYYLAGAVLVDNFESSACARDTKVKPQHLMRA